MKTVKRITHDDKWKLERIKKLKKYFIESKENYIEMKGYYISIKKYGDEEGYRFYFRGKYLVEFVVDKEMGPHKNIAEFVLFSNFDDAVLYAVLLESTFLYNNIKGGENYDTRSKIEPSARND